MWRSPHALLSDDPKEVGRESTPIGVLVFFTRETSGKSKNVTPAGKSPRFRKLS